MTDTAVDTSLIEAARSWLLDCFDDEWDQLAIAKADDATIRRGVDRYWEGGWSDFVQVNA